MNENTHSNDLSFLLKQRDLLENQISDIRSKLNLKRKMLDERLDSLYVEFKDSDYFIYGITNIDFYFGSLFCCYDGDNSKLSNKLLALNEELVNTNVFDLTHTQLKRIYNLLVNLYHEEYGNKFTLLRNNRLHTNDILDMCRILVEGFTQHNKNNKYKECVELIRSIQKLYVLLDFGLYEDKAHIELRAIYNDYIKSEADSYSKTSEYEENLAEVDEKIALLKSRMEKSQNVSLEKVCIDQNLPTNNIACKTKKNHSTKLLKGIGETLSGVSLILYYFVRIIVALLPFIMIGGNFFLNLLLITINTFVPFASVLFWVWGLISAITGTQDIWAIVYYIAFVIIWLPFFISNIQSVFSKK